MLVKSSVLVLLVASELVPLYRPLSTSVGDVFVPGGGKGELLKIHILLLLEPSVDGSMLDSIFFS